MIDSTVLTSIAKNYKVLIVEDDVKLQNKFTHYFNDLFQNSFITTNEEETLEVFNKYSPEIIIVDIDIINFEGFNLIKKIKNDNIFSQVIVISDYSEIQVLLNCIHTGVTEYLPKPLNIKNFERAIIKALNNIYLYKNIKEEPKTKEVVKNNQNPFESIEKLLKNNHNNITLVNNYKGIQIKHDSTLVEVNNNLLTVTTNKTQLYALKHENSTILRTEHIPQEILLDIEKIDFINKKVYLCNPKYIGASSRIRKDIRIEPDSEFVVSMYKTNGQSVDTVLVDISMSSLSVKIPSSVNIFEEKESINVKIQLDFAPSVTFKDVIIKNIIACKAEILLIKTIDKDKKVILLIELSNHDKDILSKYILQREIALIEEFKGFIIKGRRQQ